jgi:hypothetical protein
MNTLELEREILFTVKEFPERQSTPGYSVAIFTGPRRKIAEAISGISEDDPGKPIDDGILSARSGLSLADLFKEFTGCYKLSAEAFQVKVNELLRARKNSELMKLLDQEKRTELKTGSQDEKALARIREIVREIDELEKPEAASCSRLSMIEAKTINWIWGGRIPLGMLTLIAGDPGLGKSFLSVWIASRFSTGGKFPDNDAPAIPGGIIYLSAEDSASYAIRPRADANHADPSKIYVLEDSSLDIAQDLKRIRAQVDEDPSIKLLFIDPLNSFLGQVDYFKDTSVRTVLAPLCRFLEERNIAGIGIMHLNKKIDLGGIYRIGGSIAFAGVARSVLAVTAHPEDEDKRLLRSLKMNYAKKPAALAFSIHDDLSLTFDDKPVLVDQNDALSQTSCQDGGENSFAAEWLQERLADEGAELKQLIKDAGEVGISRRTLFYCRKKLGIKTHAQGFRQNKTSVWELPHE